MSSTLVETAVSGPVIWGTAGAIVTLLALSAFFSGSETALTAASRFKLKALADNGNSGAQTAMDLTEDNERLIGSVLLGNNLVNILGTSLATSLLTVLLGDGGVVAATALMTALILIFAEVMPKTYAITNPETAASRVSPIIRIVVTVLSPVVSAVQKLVRATLRMFGVDIDPNTNVLAAQEEIAGAIALHHSEGGMLKDDRDRLLGALDLKSREVKEIMLHRSNIEMIDAASTPSAVLAQAMRSTYTRIPVFEEHPENIIGLLHSKDLLRSLEPMLLSEGKTALDFDLRAVMMEPYFVPDTTTLNDQLHEFLRRHAHFALVIDEYGALEGLITLEDIIEEITGEISDEHDEELEGLEKLADGTFLIEGAMTIRDLNRAADWNLPDEEANTIAGLIIHEAQTIPTVGQVFSYHGFRFEVVARERNRLTQIKARPLD